MYGRVQHKRTWLLLIFRLFGVGQGWDDLVIEHLQDWYCSQPTYGLYQVSSAAGSDDLLELETNSRSAKWIDGEPSQYREAGDRCTVVKEALDFGRYFRSVRGANSSNTRAMSSWACWGSFLWMCKSDRWPSCCNVNHHNRIKKLLSAGFAERANFERRNVGCNLGEHYRWLAVLKVLHQPWQQLLNRLLHHGKYWPVEISQSCKCIKVRDRFNMHLLKTVWNRLRTQLIRTGAGKPGAILGFVDAFAVGYPMEGC